MNEEMAYGMVDANEQDGDREQDEREGDYKSRKNLTWKTPVGTGLIISGTRFEFLKPVAALGSEKGSTFLSSGMSKIDPTIIKPNTRIKKYLIKKTGTAVRGRIAGRIASRFVPYAGWVLLAKDGYNYGRASIEDMELYNNNQEEWFQIHQIQLQWALNYGERE